MFTFFYFREINQLMVNKTNDVWATEKEDAEHYKIKPATLRKNRSVYGHDGALVYRKIGGSVRYNLDINDRELQLRDLINKKKKVAND